MAIALSEPAGEIREAVGKPVAPTRARRLSVRTPLPLGRPQPARTTRWPLVRPLAFCALLAALLATAMAAFHRPSDDWGPILWHMDTIDAWLRQMTVTPAPPVASAPYVSPEGLELIGSGED